MRRMKWFQRVQAEIDVGLIRRPAELVILIAGTEQAQPWQAGDADGALKRCRGRACAAGSVLRRADLTNDAIEHASDDLPGGNVVTPGALRPALRCSHWACSASGRPLRHPPESPTGGTWMLAVSIDWTCSWPMSIRRGSFA